MRWRNAEGYTDNTAGRAIANMVKRERKERKEVTKRSCRRTKDESKVHEKAVKMRKMTDDQLVSYVENRVEKARSEGRNEVKKDDRLNRFMISLAVPGAIPGVGPATVDKIKKFMEEGGFIG